MIFTLFHFLFLSFLIPPVTIIPQSNSTVNLPWRHIPRQVVADTWQDEFQCQMNLSSVPVKHNIGIHCEKTNVTLAFNCRAPSSEIGVAEGSPRTNLVGGSPRTIGIYGTDITPLGQNPSGTKPHALMKKRIKLPNFSFEQFVCPRRFLS